MQLAKEEAEKILSVVLDIAESMLNCGAEVSRVEDTIRRICMSYGAQRVHPFVITSSIVVTIQLSNEAAITQTRRVGGNMTDFTRLEELNDLSRKICKYQYPVEKMTELYQEKIVATIPDKSVYRKTFFGYLIATFSFAVFFGGNVYDGIAALAIAAVLWLIDHYFRRIINNQMLYLIIASFCMGSMAVIVGAIAPVFHQDKIIIGDIMILIPGLAMTNAIRDIFSGDTISGMLKLCESLMQAGMIAIGTVSAILLIGGRFG